MSLKRSELLSEPFVSVIKEFEGLSLTPYKCAAGHMTIGFGHLCEANQKPITLEQADAFLLEDLQTAYDGLKSETPHMVEEENIPSHCAGALISWIFNLGIGSFKKSTLKRRLDEYGRQPSWKGKAGDEILRWDKITDPVTGKKKTLKGLQRRRQAERAYFLYGGLPDFQGSLV